MVDDCRLFFPSSSSSPLFSFDHCKPMPVRWSIPKWNGSLKWHDVIECSPMKSLTECDMVILINDALRQRRILIMVRSEDEMRHGGLYLKARNTRYWFNSLKRVETLFDCSFRWCSPLIGYARFLSLKRHKITLNVQSAKRKRTNMNGHSIHSVVICCLPRHHFVPERSFKSHSFFEFLGIFFFFKTIWTIDWQPVRW